jgi:6-pyruvoyltetrahydropterin/6-carboxytetrahydropterin synthase
MASVYELFVEAWFSAAHRLVDYPGDCARIHGHNWKVEVRVVCRELDALGLGLDFRDLKNIVAQALDALDHATLNELDDFRTVNPSAENIAKYIYAAVRALLAPRISLSSVTVTESPGVGVVYREE